MSIRTQAPIRSRARRLATIVAAAVLVLSITRTLSTTEIGTATAAPAATAPPTLPQTMPGEADAPPPRLEPALRGKINLNTATEEQLQRLPGVGPAKAERIVSWRKKNGGFRRVADLRKVKGFGYKTLRKLEPFLDVKGDTTLVGGR